MPAGAQGMRARQPRLLRTSGPLHRRLGRAVGAYLRSMGLPMGISALIHLVVIGLLGLHTWRVLSADPDGEYEIGLRPLPRLPAGTFIWPGPATAQPSDPENIRPVPEFEVPPLQPLRGMESRDPQASDLADDTGGFGLGESGRSGLLGLGGGAGEGGGAGLGEGFGQGSGIGHASIWDLRVSGNRFAYVIDFSGSIVVVVDELKRELKRSIGQLRSGQMFNVILFYSTLADRRERFATESFAPDLQPASVEVKRRVFEWLDRKAPMGSTDPLPAMKRALALAPQAIFFFSDGYFDDKVVEEIARANRTVQAQIHCVVFDEILLANVSGAAQMSDGARRLKRIAEASGGKFKIVTGADLKRR